MPQVNGTPAGAVTLNGPSFEGDIPVNTYTGEECTGGDKYYYAPIYFKWELHMNEPAVPGYLPTVTFSATWKYQNLDTENTTFEISAPVVRPKGETNYVQGWPDSRANWMMTLQCCDAANNGDPDFDFSGEMVKEVYGTVTLNSCQARAPGALGSTPAGEPAKPWTVAAGNTYGPDSVGFDPCTVEAYRCAGANVAFDLPALACGYTVNIQMYIQSPADTSFTYVYSNNVNGGGLGPSFATGITPSAQALKQFWGFVFSQRATPLGGQVRDFRGFVSNAIGCMGKPAVSNCGLYK